MDRRNTFQKELVLNAVVKMRSHVTAEEVYAYVVKEHPTVGKSTVYRNLAILSEEGKIRKIEVPEAPDRYDFTTEKHYHVRCVRCGKLLDADTDGRIDPEAHLLDTNGMLILDHDILFRGICRECQKEEKKA